MEQQTKGSSMSAEVFFGVLILAVIIAMWIFSHKETESYSKISSEQMQLRLDMVTKADFNQRFDKLVGKVEEHFLAADAEASEIRSDTVKLRKDFEVLDIRFHNMEKSAAGRNQTVFLKFDTPLPVMNFPRPGAPPKDPKKVSNGAGAGALIKRAAGVNQ